VPGLRRQRASWTQPVRSGQRRWHVAADVGRLSSGAYLDLVGVESDEGIAFQRTTAEGARQRMVWLNVTADTLRWEWQRSEGDGDKWTVMWPLDYRRLR